MENENPGEVTPLSVSAYFDDTHRKYLKLVGGDEETGSQSYQARTTEMIGKLEDLTRQVSVLGILSDNENYKEMNPSELKFILLPFMMGNLWQLSTKDSRENVCHTSKVYFRDYLERCYNYEVIPSLPIEAKPDREKEEEKGASEAENSTNKSEASARPLPKINSDDLRVTKIQKFKEAKVLDELITPYLSAHMHGQSLDDEDLRIFIISLLKRNALEAESQLRSIAQELELIRFAAKLKVGSSTDSSTSSASTSKPHNHHHSHSAFDQRDHKGNPNIFILTKSDMEKQVFGAGYPAIPVMTVEELYEQRRKTGQWGPHSGVPASLHSDENADEDKAQTERLEEEDDDELLARQRQMDDYKDDHRRGWGNRYNRS